jgi:hypothetical protein
VVGGNDAVQAIVVCRKERHNHVAGVLAGPPRTGPARNVGLIPWRRRRVSSFAQPGVGDPGPYSADYYLRLEQGREKTRPSR